MRDDLIGFVLGALDSEEQESLRRRIEQDQELQQQVQQIERCLRPLAALKAEVQPPQGLAARACDCLTLGMRSEPVRSDMAAPRPARPTSSPPTPASRLSAWGAERAAGYGEVRQWALADFVVAAGVCLAAACLFFPALSNSRYNVQLTGCQNNMYKMGQSLAIYSDNFGGYFPRIPAYGNASFAGIYAPILYTSGLMDDVRVLNCPSKASTVVIRFSLKDIDKARGPQLVRIRNIAGGDYNYALGYLVRGRLRGIRNRGDAYTPILADSPLENIRNAAITTHGRGQNVLKADGHVAFIGTRILPGRDGDDIFANELGEMRAGLHANDSVLGSSPVSPLPVSGSSGARSRAAR